MPVPAGGGTSIEPDRLATVADLAAILQISEADLDTVSAGVLLEGATAAVQAAAGQRILEVADDEVTLYGSTWSQLDLPERPVTAVTSVTYGATLLSQGTASGTWRVIPNGVWRDTGWTDTCYEPSPVTVVYTHGYPEGSQQLQLARSATLSLARGLYANPGGATREQIDDYAVAYDKAASALEATPSLRAALRRQYGRRSGVVRIG
jgi:hypothetical protein